jgi:hypothetical protein
MTAQQGRDPFTDYDAAYVLGALDPPDRDAFETHLRDCERCARAVRELSTLPGLLARVPESELRADVPRHERPAPTLLPSLLARVRRQRLVRRWSLGIGAAVLAAAAAVGAIVLPASHPSTPSHRPVAMSAVAGAPIEATVALKSVAWGTAIQVDCRYEGSNYPTSSYQLVEIDRSGATRVVGTWRVLPGIRVVVQASTDTPVTGLRELEIQTDDGTVVSRLLMPTSGVAVKSWTS